MELNRQEQEILDGENGEAQAKAMAILEAVGNIYGADRLIPASSAQVAGVSYRTIGDAGLEFLSDFAAKGAKAAIPSYLNPAGMDLENWEKMGVPREFAQKQLQIMSAYAKMGISPTCTCAPYHIGIRPKPGEHVAWSESNAISFANSVLGGRTNRESAVSALASAITGKTPNFGLHLDENRKAGFVVNVSAKMEKMTDFGALGAIVGKLARDRVPAFVGIQKANATEERMKSLGAAMAATGSVALYFAEGITPEWNVPAGGSIEAVEITQAQIDEQKAAMQSEKGAVGLVAIGCPHCSLGEIKEIAKLLAERKKPLAMKLWVCTSRKTKEEADRLGYCAAIEKAGGLVVADTCMVVAPLEEMGFASTAVNSGKAAAYLPSLCGQRVKFADIEELLG
jgi:predicted aconitase